MGGEQRWDEEEEDVEGEDPPLHHVRLPHTQGALLFGVLEHKVSGWREGQTDRQDGQTKAYTYSIYTVYACSLWINTSVLNSGVFQSIGGE